MKWSWFKPFLLSVFALFLLRAGTCFASPLPTPPSILTDLDGDQRPDLIESVRIQNQYLIKVHFLDREEHLHFQSANEKSLILVSADVNQDQFPDILLLEKDSLTPVVIWINDGKGHFKRFDSWICSNLPKEIPNSNRWSSPNSTSFSSHSTCSLLCSQTNPIVLGLQSWNTVLEIVRSHVPPRTILTTRLAIEENKSRSPPFILS